ncbi:EFR1 family ferrodoxin [Clostridium aminobutyricum]|uniref:EFR1 family ferrodoxin n=1 Tax=Clostridium aminobutyricum TaxID=33953 RepID=A0A939D9C2_CLOAM|nr:EFR1 family ferrodoxin [Clostridium aminobutyricum]MBN7773556.1 EFR1 family ferrodoxin [Clostridium aminobutyricum]
MNTTIYYFSGTGNCLKVAKDLSEQLEDAKIVKISNKNMSYLKDTQSDAIGFVFPVYFLGIPAMLKSFIENLQINNDAYIFAIATYGGSIGAPFKEIRTLLQSKNIELSAEFAMMMPGNYQVLYPPVSPEEQTKLFKNEQEQIKSIASAVKASQHVTYKVSALINAFSKPLYSIFFKPKEKDKYFWTDEQCNGCGICSQVCPANNIIIKEGKPTWTHQCEACLACLQWCPQASIQYKKSTVNRGRYHHPEIELKEFLEREIE